MNERRGPSRALLGVLGALTAFGPLSIDMYLPALPTIQRELATTAAATQRTLSAFFVGLALSQLVYGPLADRIGRRKPLFVGLGLYTLASVGAAFAPTVEALTLMRFVQAVGSAAGVVVTRAVIRDLYSGRAAASALSLLMLIMGAAPILAPLLGGGVLAVAGWRAIFAVLAGCGALTLLAVATILPETGRPSRSGAVARAYLELIRDRRFVGYTLAGGFGSAGMFAYIAGSPFVLIEMHRVSPGAFGWFFGVNALGLIAMSQLNRRLLVARSSEGLLAFATAWTAIAGIATFFVARSGFGGLPGIAVALFAFVSSLGLSGPNATALAMEGQPARAGAASALLGTLQFSLAAGASFLVGVLGERSATPMGVVMMVCGVLAFVVQARTTRAASPVTAS